MEADFQLRTVGSLSQDTKTFYHSIILPVLLMRVQGLETWGKTMTKESEKTNER